LSHTLHLWFHYPHLKRLHHAVYDVTELRWSRCGW